MTRKVSDEGRSRKVMFIGALGLLVLAAGLTSALDPKPDTAQPTDAVRAAIGPLVSRDHSDFRSIELNGAVELTVKRGPYSVEVAVEDNDQTWVETRVEDGVLVITAKDDLWDSPDVRVNLAMPTFEGLLVNGAVQAAVTDIVADQVMIEMRGAGDIDLEGRCTDLVIVLKGAGNIEADDLTCDTADIALNGAGNVEAFASKSAKARLSGIGKIDIQGHPESVDERLDGMGEIDIR